MKSGPRRSFTVDETEKILKLRDEGLTLKQIATRMGRSTGTVSNLLQRAKVQ